MKDYYVSHQADERLALQSQLSLQNSSNTLICPQRHRRITLTTIRRACNPSRRRRPKLARTFNTVLLILNLLLVTTPIPYSQAQQSQADQSIMLHTELVVFDAQVVSKKTGRVVGGLSKEHFTLYEDAAKQHITHFSQDKLPLSIVLLLDLSGSVWPLIDQIQDGGLRALRRLKPEDEVALMVFDTEAAVIQDFTQDRHLIASKIADTDEMKSILHSAQQTPSDGTHIADNIYQAANHLLKLQIPSAVGSSLSSRIISRMKLG